MNERGFTLIELLVSVAMLTIVAVAIGVTTNGFYPAAERIDLENRAQTWLQRQAAIINDELTLQIQPATSLLVTTCSGVANSLQVVNAGGTYCFRRNSSAGTQLFEDRPGGGQWNLLTLGSPLLPGDQAVSTVDGSCPSAGGFCVSTDGQSAVVTVRLRFHLPEGGAGNYQTMTFATTIARRN